MNSFFKKMKNFGNVHEIGIIFVFFILFIGFSFATPYFFSVRNLLTVLRQISLTGIMAIGMTLVIVSGEIDLSISSIYGLTSIVIGLCMVAGYPIILSIVLGCIVGLLCGIVNGVLVAYAKIPSFIATLGMMSVLRGISLLITDGLPVVVSARTVPNTDLSGFFFIGQGKFFDKIPIMALILIFLTIIGYIFFNKTLFGFYMRAVGGNIDTAIASGIKVKFIKVSTFAFTGLFCGIAGVLNLSFITSVRADSGAGLELQVISAVILGGTLLSGGTGTIIGTLIGVCIIGILNNGLILMGLSPFWKVLAIGIVIIVAVFIDTLVRREKT